MAEASGSPRAADRVTTLALILALALAVLRVVGLGRHGLWLDEVLALADALHGEDQKNPLGYTLLQGWLALFPERAGEAVLRFPSALLGALGVPLTYVCLRGALGRRRAAVAALLVAASGWHLYWSQTARFYTLAQGLGLVGGGLLLLGLRRERVLPVITGVVAAGLGATVHPSAAVLAGALVVAPLVARRLARRDAGGLPSWAGGRVGVTLVLVGAAGALGGLPWVVDVWRQWELANVGAGTPAHFVQTTGFFVTPVLGAAALVGTLVALRGRRVDELTLALVPVIGVFGVFVASMVGRAGAQYVFVQLPFVAAAAALCVPRAREGPPATSAVALVLVVVAGGLGEIGLYTTVRHGERPRWREAWALVDARREPGDLLLGVHAPVGEYYLTDGTDLRDLRTVTYLDRFTAPQVEEWTRHARRTWLVVNVEEMEEWERADRDAVLRVLREECRLVRAFPVRMDAKDLDVLVYLRE